MGRSLKFDIGGRCNGEWRVEERSRCGIVVAEEEGAGVGNEEIVGEWKGKEGREG